ncbi:30S ribosomal protein S21 [candidate division WOR_3 bacterium SM23_60]|jgi:small subunit ribosomal protein S21|uniref:Small ribosomal subunit protein bS21 n=1 Tax=candidate division WOR_3 bacterium SM23_60 TaxID=1703780 RepID=A0A0S8GDV4_UNCW3|nr:MAG: 30S ribosomal protein S21 [candidate division WOR_3 bacterium SM23_60]
MTKVTVYDGESFENAIRRFRKSVERAGILRDVKKHEVYEKPSEKRKRRLIAARKKEMKRQREEI